MKYLVLILSCIFISTKLSNAQELTIFGRTIDKNGIPVVGAKVDLVEKNVSVTTDSLGRFYFNQTSTNSAVSTKLMKSAVYSTSTGRINFHLNSLNDNVSVKAYGSSGKLISSIYYNNLNIGKNSIDIFNGGTRLSKGFYFIQFQNGTEVKVFKANNVALSNTENSQSLNIEKRDGINRQNFNLVISKEGFKDINTSIATSGDVDLGDIIMLQYPLANISNITDNQDLSFGDSIKISVIASDPDDDKIRVTFIIDSVKYQTDSIAPYEYTWNSIRGNIGNIPVVVVVEDNDSLFARDSVNVSLNFDNERTYSYEIINAYDHDNTSYTQGLVHADGIFYEGSGLYNKSVLRKVEVETGNIIKNINLGGQYFGEGITIWNDTILQLTWRENVIFTYDKETFTSFDTLYNPHDGWGITHDNNKLIISDGSAYLYFWDPHSITQTDSIRVHDRKGSLSSLNELEYFYKKVFANIYQTSKIAIINHETGDVLGKVDFTGLPDFNDPQAEVLNGIAYDPIDDRIFITGKHWSNLYEVKLKLVN